MRMLLFFVLLLIPAVADAANCSNFNNNSETCGNTPGCHYHNDIQECKKCAENHFCTGWHNNQRECSEGTDGEFPKSDAGAESINECYRQIVCKWADDTDKECKHYRNNTYSCPSTDPNGIHIENDQCYIGRRDCSLFNKTGCNGAVTGDVYWQNNVWHTNNCKCNFEPFTDNYEYFCNGQRHKDVVSTSVNSVNDTIDYTNGTITRYWCESCLPGYYVESSNISPVGSMPCVHDIEQGGPNTACKCTPAPQGTWITSCNISYPITDPDILPCSTTNCAAGKTTTGTGSTNSNACHYGSETQICDSAGCVNLSNFGTPESWTDL